jgi:23S rRNA (cytosine1962-C5)-methyltransferase
MLADTADGVVFKFRNDDRKSLASGRVVVGDARVAEALVVEQPGYRFEAHLTSDLDAGAYPDAEDLRRELLNDSSGKRLLNVFAYTCLFGVVALLGGARSAVNVDVSRRCLRRGQRNYVLNGLRVDGRDFVAADALRFLRRAARAGERWDEVIVDPPPFFSTGKLRRASDETIEECVEAALGVAAPGGRIHLLQCTARLAADELARRVEAVLARASVRGELELRTWSGSEVSARELAPTFKEARVRVALT